MVDIVTQGYMNVCSNLPLLKFYYGGNLKGALSGKVHNLLLKPTEDCITIKLPVLSEFPTQHKKQSWREWLYLFRRL